MGAYLNKPVTVKEKEEGSTDSLDFAVTTMQGWRANQEDAHNCVTDLHDGWHMFAVYDGHGGTEVSKFTSAKFPEFLKKYEFWNASDVEDCLQKAFVEFDELIRAEDSMKELKEIGANVIKTKKTPEDDSEDEADRIDTIEESGIPLAELIRRYGSGGGAGRSLFKAFLSAKELDDESDEDDEKDEEDAEETEENAEENEEGNENKQTKEGEEMDTEEVQKAEGDKKKVQKRCNKSPIQSEAKKSKSSEEGQGDVEEAQGSSSATQNEEEAAEEVAEEDESDEDFNGEGEGDDEGMSDEEEETTDIGQFMLGNGGAETPGEDSGTTACVCLIGKDKVIVANAGDSRAVLCRDGKAIDLSVDHKPEDDVETNRIKNAGGAIEEGRVNGGLNLSRALGDHAYKKNHTLPLKDQMITAHPDVKIVDLTKDDEFIVVACDGIWNSMESQQVVDFVRKLVQEGKSCSEICDELCDACLAETTDGDGTGCDNMTVICTTFKR